MSDKWTLVTGANGFLGAHLVRELVARGHKVKAFVRTGADLRQLQGLPPESVRIAVGDARVVDRVYAAMNACDTVYHLAASVFSDERKKKQIVADAVEGTEATLEAARRAGLRRAVVTSTLFTLGVSERPEPIDETHAFNVDEPNAYAFGKREGEQKAFAAASSSLDVVVVNPGMIVGAGDYKPTGTGAMFLNYLKTAPTWNVPILPGGLNFVDVRDVAIGHVLAMEKGRSGERYVLGGTDLTHREFYTLLCDLTGLAEPGKDVSRSAANWVALFEELRARWSGKSPVFTRRLIDNYYGRYVFLNSDKAKRDLGYEPRPVREAFANSLRWYVENGYVTREEARRVRLELRPAVA